MLHRSLRMRPLAGAALGLTLAVAVPVRALPAVQFGLLGLARLQTARVNLVSLPNGRPLPPDAPPNPCVAVVSFLDDTGRVFVDRLGESVALEVSLEAGESAALELPAAVAFQGRRGLRQPFRVSLEQQPGPPTVPDGCAALVITLEIFDNVTGRTSVLYVNPGPPNADPGPLTAPEEPR